MAAAEFRAEALYLKFWLLSNKYWFCFLKTEKKTTHKKKKPHKKSEQESPFSKLYFFPLSCTNYRFSSLSAELVEAVLSA